ncbi:MAG: hypothetical protein IRZ16_19865 [Myxococcaceae bacterium]|nr:hypothetical protein [Myxococcaceae bacterium]
MNARYMVFGAVFGLMMGTFVAGCDDDECDSDCQGCCDSEGVCQAGDTPNACGTGAAACVACAAGQSCTNGVCVTPDAGADAGTDAGVDAGVDGGTGDGGVGDPCMTGSDCSGGLCLTLMTDGFAGGYCSQTCSDTVACPAGSSCGFDPRHCLEDCPDAGTGQSTCRTGYVCDAFLIDDPAKDPFQGSCFPACTDDASATSTGHCFNGYECGDSFFHCCDNLLDGGFDPDSGMPDPRCPVSGDPCAANGYCIPVQ